MLTVTEIRDLAEQFLSGRDYEVITLEVSGTNDILLEVDSLSGVDVALCEELNRYLVAQLEAKGVEDYSLEVGSVSLTAPFKTRMQYNKHLGHPVEVLVEGKKVHGQLVSVDEDTFSVDVEEKVKVEGKKRPEKQMVTYTWRYDEVKYCCYEIQF